MRTIRISGALMLLTLACTLNAQQQIPGYLGSKLSVDVDATLLMLDLDLGLGGHLGYTVSRKVELLTGYSVVSSNGEATTRRLRNYTPPGNGDEQYRLERDDRAYDLNRVVVGMNIYLDGHIAPLGRHLRLGIARLSIDPGEVDLVTLTDRSPSMEIDRESIDQTFDLMAFEIGYYDRNIISGKIFMDYGLSLNYVHRGKYGGVPFSAGKRNNYQDNNTQDFIDNTIPRHVGFDVQMTQILAFEMGFGFIF